MTCLRGVVADKESCRGHMIPFGLFSIHAVSAGSGSLSSDAVENSAGPLCPLPLALFSRRTIPMRGGARVPHPLAGWQRRGTWCGLRPVPRARKKPWSSFDFCWKCGVQPVRSLPAPRYPQRPPVLPRRRPGGRRCVRGRVLVRKTVRHRVPPKRLFL